MPDFTPLAVAGPSFTLISSLDGAPWGVIPACLTTYPSPAEVAGGEVVIPHGNAGEGYLHFTGKHGHKITRFHPGLTPETYLQNVLRDFQRMYLQADGSLWLLRTNGTTKCAVVAPLILDGTQVYKLITAYPLTREPNFARRGAIRLTVR